MALTLNLLGELEVIRDGQPVVLPPSRKTRALLAYLALHPRALSREHLCDLLWELPDDPRGSLRWSLSKLRRLVDTPGRTRLRADRAGVALDTSDMDIDVSDLHGLLAAGLQRADTRDLEAAAQRYRGPFLEGLELDAFHDFHAWCLAERESAMRAQTALLAALVERLLATPERALPHAHAWVRLAPFDEAARAHLVRLLLALHRPREAEQQLQLGMRLLREAGLSAGGELLRAWRAPRAAPPGGEPEAPAAPLGPVTEPPDDATLEVLRWAALLAPGLDPATLGRVSGLDTNRIGAALEAAERRQWLVTGDEGPRFPRQELVDAFYAGISPTRRQAMHRRIAEWLAEAPLYDLEHAADLAHHAQASGDPELAARAMITAGRLCLRIFANDEAQRFAQRGLAMAERLAGTRGVCLALELHDILYSAAPLADWEAGAGEVVALAEQALEHGALAHARLGYQLASHICWAHGQWSGAHEEALQAERVTRCADDREQVIAMAETARCLAMLERDLDQAAEMLAQARDLANQRHLSHPALPLAQGLLCLHADRFDEAERHFQDARTLCKASGDRLGEFQAQESLLLIDLERDDYPQARERCRALLALGERLRDGSEAPFAAAAEALCHYALEDDAGPFDVALVTLRHADARHRLALLLLQAARLDLERGRIEAVRARAVEALEHARVLERHSEQLLALTLLAEAARRGGDADARHRHAEAAAALLPGPVAGWARRRHRALAAAPEDTG
ncbi:BTAD domain-containing putative transcriptional regulator [Halomonas ramblicola]|uniref:BTAD domain-containing putative transcriptional regulator n=1 Tax=Halomonas ramblicola TaxID=747349 RepID=UPI0025B4F694|nr:BTAD domain-containing putative transcriptional regulator [Halomonas ramblicola]MDN3521106.1 BTAD domain-containing putative transcriptional regulator [Halomonas ramblicola]